MNAETVPLIKGAVTCCAGKLPVALINTACVFKVPIAVIFVGKDFAASLARKAVKKTCDKVKTKLNQLERSLCKIGLITKTHVELFES